MPSKSKAVKPQKGQNASPSTSKVAGPSTGAKVSLKAKLKAVKPPAPITLSDEEDAASNDGDEEVVVPPTGSEEEDDEDIEDEGEEDEDEDEEVDQAGMEKLMKLLGEDGLDDFAKAELEALAADDEIEDDEDEDEAGGSVEGDAETHDEDEEEDEEVEEEEHAEDEDEEDAAEQEDDAVLLEDADSVDEDAVPRQKIEIDNKIALERIRDTIKLDPSMPWTETLVVTYPETIEVDVDDDLNRELAFYKQALHGAKAAKALAAKHDLPFTRPADYFAEMVKSDSHMERIRQRLLDETASIKHSEDKRKEREGKKFGKQVQIEKLKERERSKKDIEERLKGLKRKRKGALDNAEGDDDAFDVAVEDALTDRPSKRARGGARGGRGGISRQARDQKFGFGGAGRRSKQNTKSSTDDFEPLSGGRGGRGGGRGGSRGGSRGGRGGRGGARGGAKRLGKSRRVTARSRS